MCRLPKGVVVLPLVLSVLLEPTAVIAQQATTDHRSDIVRLLELTHAVEMGEELGGAMAEEMINMLKVNQPGLPTRVFEIIREESVAFAKNSVGGDDGMLEDIIAVYADQLSPEDTRELVRFYETPAGKRIADAMPEIQRRSMEVGRAWGERMGPALGAAITTRLQEEGFVP